MHGAPLRCRCLMRLSEKGTGLLDARLEKYASSTRSEESCPFFGQPPGTGNENTRPCAPCQEARTRTLIARRCAHTARRCVVEFFERRLENSWTGAARSASALPVPPVS